MLVLECELHCTHTFLQFVNPLTSPLDPSFPNIVHSTSVQGDLKGLPRKKSKRKFKADIHSEGPIFDGEIGLDSHEMKLCLNDTEACTRESNLRKKLVG